MVPYQAVFFDFDGVILDSVNVKTKAFAKMFRQYGPDIERKVVEYHLVNGGVSRFEKFQYYYEQLLTKSITEEEIDELSKQFSDMVVQDVIDCEFVDGAFETLVFLKRHFVPTFIVSGTPHEEIQHIVIKKKLAHFFNEVHGSPNKKCEIVADILNRKGYEPAHCLFIGDAMSDYRAAQETNMAFLGVVPRNIQSPFPEGTLISPAVFVCNSLVG